MAQQDSDTSAATTGEREHNATSSDPIPRVGSGQADSPSLDEDVIVDVQRVSKKYCRQLKRSMWYGVKDVCRDLTFQKRKWQMRTGEFQAVKKVSFQVRRGECVGLIGANGAGKSSMLKILSGIFRPDRGKVVMKGKVGALLELNTGMNLVLSGRENAYIKGAMYGLSKLEIDERMDEIIDFSGMEGKIDAPMRMLSSGEKARIAFSVAMNLRPDLLLIDEVLAVGDIGFKLKCFDHLQKMVKTGMSIILVTHMVSRLPRVCNRTIVLDKGEVAFDGDVQQAIGIYHQLVGAADKELKQRRKKQDADVGLPGASIAQVKTFNERDEETDEFETGDKLIAEVEIEADQHLDGMRLVVGIHSVAAGQVASVATPYQDFRFELQPGKTVIRLELTNLPLLVGGYYFNVSLSGPTMSHFYHRRISAAAFRMVGPPIDATGHGINGLIKLDHNWSLKQ